MYESLNFNTLIISYIKQITVRTTHKSYSLSIDSELEISEHLKIIYIYMTVTGTENPSY